MREVEQLSVFAENKPGKLTRITEILLANQINIRAITIASGEKYGIIRLLVDDPSRAFKTLKKAGLSVVLMPVLAFEMKDEPGGLHRITGILSRCGINVEDAYGFVVEPGKKAVLIAGVEKLDEAREILIKEGVEFLSPEDLYQL